jgi:hypothetical protein
VILKLSMHRLSSIACPGKAVSHFKF